MPHNEPPGFVKHLGGRLHRATLPFKRPPFSNFGEERILKGLAAELLPERRTRTAVDIGAGDGVKASNTYALFLDGWKGLGVEENGRRALRLAQSYRGLEGVAACHARVTPANVVGLLESYGVARDFDLLSLDIDSYDYFVLDPVLEHFRPSLVVAEINEKIPPPIKFAVKYDPDFRPAHHFFGQSIALLAELCDARGYSIVALEYNNAFLAARELKGARPLTAEQAYRQGYLDRPDRREKFWRNADVEELLTLSPEQGVEFIRRFYAGQEGRYVVGV